MRILVLWLALGAAGCFDPQITDGGFACDPAETKACPDGYACRDVRGRFVCTRGPATPLPDGDVAGADDLLDHDGPPADMAAPLNCGISNLVINEVLTRGSSASDEWVELFNPCDMDVTFSGKLVYRGPTSTSDSATLVTLTSRVIPRQGYFLIANMYAGTADIKPFDGGTAVGLGDTGGGVALRDGADQIVTSMAWGSGTNNGFQHGTPAPAPSMNQSVARAPNGADTHNDAADFALDLTPTPRAINN
jgi:hypothetical protein